MNQIEFKKIKGWGGKRRGAGRKNITGGVAHTRRERVSFKTPLHITMKLKPRIANLRTKRLLMEFRRAIQKAKVFNLHVLHYSLQGDHLHIIAETSDARELARGMKSFGSCFGKAIRKAIGGEGSVFKDRYHLHVLKTPTEMKNALKYVLLNFAKHARLIEHIDDYSSGYAFKDWLRLLGRKFNGLLESQLEGSFKIEELSPARSWLAREGWMRAAA